MTELEAIKQLDKICRVYSETSELGHIKRILVEKEMLITLNEYIKNVEEFFGARI
jgi:hypothetical protein